MLYCQSFKERHARIGIGAAISLIWEFTLRGVDIKVIVIPK